MYTHFFTLVGMSEAKIWVEKAEWEDPKDDLKEPESYW